MSDDKANELALCIINFANSSYPSVSSTDIQVEKIGYFSDQLQELLAKKGIIS